MAKITEEIVETSYSGNVFSRLFVYMKPYLKRMFFCLCLVLLITCFDLVKPMLIAEAIDTYIEGYNRPYAVVSQKEGEIEYKGIYLTKNFNPDQVEEFAQLIYFEDQYYYFEGLNSEESERLNNLGQNRLDEAILKDESLSIVDPSSNQVFIGKKMEQEDLKILRSADFSGIIQIGILYAVILLLKVVCNVAQTWLLQLTGQNIIFSIRQQIFQHIHSLPLRYFDTNPVGRIVTRATNDVESLHQMYANILVRLFSNAVLILGYAVVMLRIHVRMALICFALLPFVLVLSVFFKKISRRIYRVIRTKVSVLNTFLSENISGMKIIQLFAQEQEKYEEFKERSEDLYHSNMKEIITFAIFQPLIVFISNLALALVVYQGANSVLDGTLTVGTLYIFGSYIISFYSPIQSLAEQFTSLQNAFASAEKIFTVLDEKNPILESENPVILDKVEGKIEFKHVWFAYENEDYVLKDISFTIEPGKKVAFVGATGAGKSSILNLIGRYYEIQKGQILIDGVDIRKLSTKQIRQAIGQVQQDVFIFTGDIRSNIRLLNEEIEDKTILEASKAVNASHFIDQLPNQYDEAVTERGSTLSSGQRQLLSFARTLAYDPTILVMDEATANIDTETELLIQEALETLMKGRTTIMVAHRLSTIQHADNIIVMDHGQIKESGTHQQLLEQNGIYKKLYDLQLYGE